MAGLKGHDLLQAYVRNFVSGAQGCDMDYEAAQAVAIAIRDEFIEARNLIERLSKTSSCTVDIGKAQAWLDSRK